MAHDTGSEGVSNIAAVLFFTVPLVYFVVLAVVALIGWEKTNSIRASTDPLSAHYLAGKSFGPIYIAGTIFASLYSGITTVGKVSFGLLPFLTCSL